MRAAVIEGPGRFAVRSVPEPSLDPGDVLLEVLATGICGTDVRIFKGEHRAAKPGLVAGHEVVGRIVSCDGNLPEDLAVGDVVVMAPNIGCGNCRWCGRGQENLCPRSEALGITLDGGFAEFVRVPAPAVRWGNLIRIGAGRTAGDYLGYVMAEPLACVVRGQRKVGVAPGESVLVCGAGPVGLAHVALANACGARVLCSEPSPERRQAALVAGAAEVAGPDEDLAAFVRRVVGQDGVDVVITAAPAPELQARALEVAATWGRILAFAGLPKSISVVELPTNQLHYKELSLVGSTASTVEDCRQAVRLISSGKVDTAGMVTRTFPLADFGQAIEAAQDRSGLKVAVLAADQEGTS
ncbi:MAG: alcohol dehydrogenase catalytic domain-containing protein [Bifidobacteriaceae bacterium]|jgi:L-iditol 2-dehydrogenase|nr:alcohol dehydrogenase catalytic domain-containing protein [Bifidobacteriaceae bacterium]